MKTKRLYVATIADDHAELAKKYGLGIELDQFTYAPYMEPPKYAEKEEKMRESMACSDRFVLHAPFADICAAAIDPLVEEVSRRRYQQAFELAYAHGVKRIVIHSGYINGVYHPDWYPKKAAAFWRDFLADKPDDVQLLIENVMDDIPGPIANCVAALDDPRCRICLDIGHAAVHGKVPVADFISAYAPYLAHVHIHDNDGTFDQHYPLGQGSLPLQELIEAIEKEAKPTYTLENTHAADSLIWLEERGIELA